MRSLGSVLVLVLTATAIQITSPQVKLTRGCESGLSRHTSGPLGDEWLSWSRTAQTEYVRGYYEGYRRGDGKGCEDTWEFFVTKGVRINMAMPEEPASNCLQVMSRWTPSHESFVARITEYYETFPTDCVVPVLLIMDSLSGQKHMTFLQIHHWYVEGELKRTP
jgi:hypothetical protein